MESKPELEFPLEWAYKIIAFDDPLSFKKISKVLRRHGVTSDLVPGNKSRGGKYLTYNVNVRIQNREAMDSLSSSLLSLDCVKFIL